MKKFFSILFLCCGLVFFSQAQYNENIQPKSFKIESAELPEITLPNFDLATAHVQDRYDSKNGVLPKFSRSIYTNISLQNSGSWYKLTNGDRIWRVKITSDQALGLVLLFDKLYLPEGALLHVYTPNKEEIIGAFTHENTPEIRAFCSGIIHGESGIIEYYEPAAQTGKGIVNINEVGHAYRWVAPLKNTADVSQAGACEVNVACSEAANWQDQKRSVARILVVAQGGQGYCSGALINNVRQDCTPYFLSAQHCSEGTTAQQYNQWVFYFNYEASGCSGTTGPQNKTVNGCKKMADSNDNGGDSGSDFLLLKLNSSPPAAYNVYYSGWNSSGNATSSGVCVHHPDGGIKKISTYSQTPTSTTWGGSVQNTHWKVKWSATANGFGVTEEGSSGSPLFSSNGMIIGTLTGGNSYCNSPNTPDQFGKVSYHWVSNGNSNTLRLKPWLDPDNTGITSLSGTNAPCGSAVQNDAGIQNISQPLGAICSNSVSPEIVLRNFGGNTLQTVIINYQIDGNVYQYAWNGNLAAGGTTNVTLPTLTLAEGSHTFTVETVFPNNVNDNNTSNDSQSFSFIISPPSGLLNLFLKTDSYGSETSWEIKNDLNQTVAAEGPYSDVTGGETLNIPICLASGCYTFVIYDTYGDGMDDGGDANFKLTGLGGTPIYTEMNTKNFGYEESFAFCINSVGIVENTQNPISIFPNPSTGIFKVSFQNADEKSISITDITGKKITNLNTASEYITLNLSGLPKGIYLLQTKIKNQVSVYKLSIVKD